MGYKEIYILEESLCEKYKKDYLSMKNRDIKNVKLSDMQIQVFQALGNLITFSQISEYFTDAILKIYKNTFSVNKPEKLDELIQIAIDNADDVINNLNNCKNFKNSIEDLKNVNLLEDELYEFLKTIIDNRNTFTHHYFIRVPTIFTNKDLMQKSINEMVYTIYAMKQSIENIYSNFRNQLRSFSPNSLFKIEQLETVFLNQFN